MILMKRFTPLIICFLLISGFIRAQELTSTRLEGSLGSVTINGTIYNQIAFRPEIPIGQKMAIGLDVYLYIDGEGNLYKDAWNFKDGKSTMRSLLDKVYYFRYGQPDEKFYLRAGALPNATLGHGILIDGYANTMEYPSVRRIGLNMKMQIDDLGFEAIVSDFKRVPGIAGVRASFEYIPKLEIGISFVTDLDQNAGLADRDSDDYPDVFDDYPDDADWYDSVDKERDMWLDVYTNLNGSDAGFEDWFATSPVLPRNPYNPDTVDSDPVSGASIDLSYNVTDKIILYSQFAQLFGDTKDVLSDGKTALGFGFVPLGISSKWGPVTFRAEYRQNSRRFLFNYWNRSYDITRATYDFENSRIVTRESIMYRYGELKGFYLQADASLLNLMNLQLGYQDMTGEVWDDTLQDYESDDNKLFRATLKVNTGRIPRVKLAQAFYQQTDVVNPFKFDPSPTTVVGYDVGIELSDGLMMIYKARRTYHFVDDGVLEPSTTVQFETQMTF